MKKFVCPIDKRIIVDIPANLELREIVANCETALPNSECKMIKFGCFGCRRDKEEILGQKVLREINMNDVEKTLAQAIKDGTLDNIFGPFNYDEKTDRHGPFMGSYVSREFVEDMKANPEYYLSIFKRDDRQTN